MRPPIEQLADLGPNADISALSASGAQKYVDALTAGSDENFHVLSRFVPEAVRPDFAAVYAFCRWSDDLADEAPRDQAPELLRWWRRELEACFADPSEARHPVFAALRQTADRHRLPIDPFSHLLDAFDQDQRVARYETWDQLLGYCQRSADPVGRIVLMLAGHRPSSEDPASAELEEWSDSICTGLQLVNFWQDVRRDLVERDRVYFPSEEAGIDAETLRDWMARPKDPEARVPYIRALRALLHKTMPMFDAAEPLIARINPDFRRAVWLFAAGGRAIGTKIDRSGCPTLWRRPKLTKLEKGSLLLRASMK
ncbi:MAG: squalene synthase HpnC [Phycisphaerae bacterium]|nr:squalene synthase HpnC [Phycisphaerae bacterium]